MGEYHHTDLFDVIGIQVLGLIVMIMVGGLIRQPADFLRWRWRILAIITTISLSGEAGRLAFKVWLGMPIHRVGAVERPLVAPLVVLVMTLVIPLRRRRQRPPTLAANHPPRTYPGSPKP